MKKWLALFVLGMVSLFATSAHAESYETTKTLKVYESRSFNSPVKKNCSQEKGFMLQINILVDGGR
ncbi:hypothetical protein AAHB59_00735 [Bacillus cereus]